MENVISFMPNTYLDNKMFLKYVWSRFYQLLCQGKKKNIVIDLNNVVFISPSVLPKLCCLGAIASKNDEIVEVIFNPTSKIKDYLGQMDFYYINHKYNLLYIDEGLTGGEIEESKSDKIFLAFDKEELFRKYNSLYTFDDSVSKSDQLKYCVRGEIFGSGNLLNIDDYNSRLFMDSHILNVLKRFFPGDKKQNYELIKEIGLNFAEIIHNSLWHGNTRCFLAMQVSKYNNKQDSEFVKLDVSLSDYGNGIFESLCGKHWHDDNKFTHFLPLDKFLTLENTYEQDYYSILEAILYRKSERVRGLYDVLQSLTGKAPLVNIVNRNTLVQLNEDKVKRILLGNNEGIWSIHKEKIQFGFGIDISFTI